MVNEGSTIAKWLAGNGITAFVVTYRLGMKYHYPAEMDDGRRSVRYVRAYATAWKLDPHRVGVIGFSAGGHMVCMVATHFDKGDPKSTDPIERVSSRPDLQVLLYPVVTMSDATVHKGSQLYLLGQNPPDDLKVYLSGEKQVTADTPPAFVCGSVVDPTVPVANSDNYVAALKKFNVPVVQLRLPTGGHGFGLKDTWSGQCLAWLHTQNF
jgi:acetyl esterase/lipase